MLYRLSLSLWGRVGVGVVVVVVVVVVEVVVVVSLVGVGARSSIFDPEKNACANVGSCRCSGLFLFLANPTQKSKIAQTDSY
jgi:hypothetical protein